MLRSLKASGPKPQTMPISCSSTASPKDWRHVSASLRPIPDSQVSDGQEWLPCVLGASRRCRRSGRPRRCAACPVAMPTRWPARRLAWRPPPISSSKNCTICSPGAQRRPGRNRAISDRVRKLPIPRFLSRSRWRLQVRGVALRQRALDEASAARNPELESRSASASSSTVEGGIGFVPRQGRALGIDGADQRRLGSSHPCPTDGDRGASLPTITCPTASWPTAVPRVA